MPEEDLDQAKNRDDEQRPGRPPHPAQQPKGSERSTVNPKTMTDPATGEPLPGAPAPAGSSTEEGEARRR